MFGQGGRERMLRVCLGQGAGQSGGAPSRCTLSEGQRVCCLCTGLCDMNSLLLVGMWLQRPMCCAVTWKLLTRLGAGTPAGCGAPHGADGAVGWEAAPLEAGAFRLAR